ncbi:uncharacterized protein MELLADRAFT_123232 [Melampsora larici-populina 98AG31]|uniref:Secreted protein n=1 Tax=Melampsora larici-populina (strain 98AG31 / pathotype 3-4-7) TaxID=747676 RepID=F4RJ06_MELLP|nr:uncharacterized protein MELLADRAFT_123232 [Melampsora larici-populina 98AG31]EGG07651.1 secreted protein [Melampsora larici-populina 98AG31]
MLNFCLGLLFLVLGVLNLQVFSLPEPKAFVKDVFKIHTLVHSRLARRNLNATSYEAYQISDGTAGTAKEAAGKLLLEPYNLTLSSDLEVLPLEALKGISKDDIKAMFKIGHDGNIQEVEGFLPAIRAAKKKKDLFNKLNRGMIANKVLKLLAQVVGCAAQIAQGDETIKLKEHLKTEQKKLAHNLKTDEENKGKPMSSFLSVTSDSKKKKKPKE